ncbi:hypothetical protein H6F98_00290 [Microcoleus sp. FACHB-SPT15]|uniref:hypothetical protein n=1 Tax=Microcoleus sp. FACHB-SPT15 TaxID=2692830 RepID=UPI00177E224B|nr:hypothetical protein [Microcoleus sp. FACHB-SPT15]MBD1803918.1 hypothetical protein [Microcoleus sp. FACHB-SPT15]
MTEILLNLTWLKLNKELSDLAAMHPSTTYKAILKNTSFRQDLINHILKEIHNDCLLVESTKDISVVAKIVKFTNQERMQVFQLIHQRLCQLRYGNKSCPYNQAGMEELKEQDKDFCTSRDRREENSTKDNFIQMRCDQCYVLQKRKFMPKSTH